MSSTVIRRSPSATWAHNALSNVVFPLELLRELAAEGMIGQVAREHVGYMGYTMQLKLMYEQTAPAIAEYVDKKAKADVVVLTGG